MHTKISKKIITLALVLILALGIFTNIALAAYTASEWAKPDLENAQSYGLIPDVLKDADLTKPITRAEFAAVSVKLYENLSGKTATPVATNPFTDTKDVEVLKACNIGLTTGTSATAFSPNNLLTREQAATMLTRSIKAAYIPGWTLASDDSYTLNFAQPAKFADDGKINAWAKQSVYYANAKGIILGTGNNMFSPAANAARQEALTIAVRMVEKLKGETVDYIKGDSPTPTPTPTPPSGNANFTGIRWRASLPYSGFICLLLNSNGEFIQEVRFNIYTSGWNFVTEWEEVYKGNYTVSGNILTLTYKSAEHYDYGKTWETISLPTSRALTYKISETEGDSVYLDISNGGFPPFNEPVELESHHVGITRFIKTDFDTPVLGR